MTHNTAERIPPSDSRTLRRIVLGLLAVLFAVNLMGIPVSRYFNYNDRYWLFSHKWRVAEHCGKLDWIVLGDSAPNQGFDAERFSRVRGPSYNFCTFVHTLIKGQLEILKTYMVRHGPPQGVLLIMADQFWFRVADPRLVALMPIPWSRLGEFTQEVESAWRFKLTVLLDRYVPLYSQPTTFQGLLRRPHRLLQPRRKLDAHGLELQSESMPEAVRESARKNSEFAGKTKFVVSEINRDAMAEMCQLADLNDFEIYAILSPIWEGAAEDTVYRAYYDQGTEYLYELERTLPRLHVLGPFPLTEPIEHMQHVYHVTRPWATAFADTVVARLRSRQAADVSTEERTAGPR
ncbi:hypothetical protein HZB60_06340 [candidate division KSB1 bacterium]|nr:hypothetical protein [candidate division KSB1 bacterium]